MNAFQMNADWLAFHADPKKPDFVLPAGAIDAHCHVDQPMLPPVRMAILFRLPMALAPHLIAGSLVIRADLAFWPGPRCGSGSAFTRCNHC